MSGAQLSGGPGSSHTNFAIVQGASLFFQGSEAKEASDSRHRLDKGFSPNLVTAVLGGPGQIQV